MGYYRSAEVCRNGHATTSSLEISSELAGQFCPSCGAETIRNCPSCKERIRGSYHVDGVIGFSMYHPPAFCHSCGHAFPWTEATLNAASEIADELEGLTDDEREKLKQSIKDLTRDTPQTELAILRYKKLLSKAGGTAASMLNKVVTAVATAAVKKELGL